MPTLESITRTPNDNKEFKAVFTKDNGRSKIIRFGTSSNYVTNATKTTDDRKNYIARHRVNENFNNPLSAGALSRWLLWGNSRDLKKNIDSFKRRFKL